MPLLPFSTFSQFSATFSPTGESAPMPVITTRFLLKFNPQAEAGRFRVKNSERPKGANALGRVK
jgi:hypothetical protein